MKTYVAPLFPTRMISIQIPCSDPDKPEVFFTPRRVNVKSDLQTGIVNSLAGSAWYLWGSWYRWYSKIKRDSYSNVMTDPNNQQDHNIVFFFFKEHWSLRSSGDSLVATPDCETAVLGSKNTAISPALDELPSGLALHCSSVVDPK
jgi:hypothetical protein